MAEGDLGAAGFIQNVVQFFAQPGDEPAVFGFVDEVFHLIRIVLEVVQFIGIPDAVVLDEFVLLPPQRKRGGSVREVPFPVILVKQIISPLIATEFTGGQLQEAATVHVFGSFHPGGFQHRGADVDVGEYVLHR